MFLAKEKSAFRKSLLCHESLDLAYPKKIKKTKKPDPRHKSKNVKGKNKNKKTTPNVICSSCSIILSTVVDTVNFCDNCNNDVCMKCHSFCCNISMHDSYCLICPKCCVVCVCCKQRTICRFCATKNKLCYLCKNK